jgi:hypothetical protein
MSFITDKIDGLCSLYTSEMLSLASKYCIKFLVVELTHPDSNLKFDMCVVFTPNYSFSGR